MTQFTSDDCVLDADLYATLHFTHHILDVSDHFALHLSVLTWCITPLQRSEGKVPSLLGILLGDLSLRHADLTL